MNCRDAIAPAGVGVLALAMLVAGCSSAADSTSNDDGASRVVDSPGTADPSEPEDDASDDASNDLGPSAALTASFRGVTPEAIKVGITAVDWETLASIGVDFGRTNALDLWVAALEDINARGGVHGRQIEIHGREFLPLGDEQFDEACQHTVFGNLL